MRILIQIIKKIKAYYLSWRVAYHRGNLIKKIRGGDGLHLEGLTSIIKAENLTLGRHVHIGKEAYINCFGGVEIGDHTIISRYVTIYSYDHNFKSGVSLPFDDEEIHKPVQIGRYVWIGMNAIIAPGTTIGDGAVIGIGTVVSGTIPDNAIVVGAKTRIVGYRDPGVTKDLADKGLFYRHSR